MLGDERLGGCNGLLHAQSVECEAVQCLAACGGRVHHGAFLGIETLLAHVGTLDERDDGQVEVSGKGVVAGVVGGHCHDGSRAVAGEHIVAHPDGDFVAREGVDGVRACEDACDAAVGNAFTLSALLGGFEISLHVGPLRLGGELCHEFALGSQHHEGYAEDGVGAGGEYGKLEVAVLHAELHLGAFGAAYPVALRFLDGVGPVERVEALEQTAGVGRHPEAPLLHLLLHHGVAAAFAHAVDHLVVGQHGAQLRAPVHHGLAQVGQAVVHQHLALACLVHGVPLGGGELQFFALRHVEPLGAVLLQVAHERFDGLGLLLCV